MAATTYTWNTIASTQTDGDSPLDETLMEAIRQNLISLEEWMGDGFTQAIDHDHDGVNSKSVLLADGIVAPAKLYYWNPGETLINSNDGVKSTTSSAWVKVKETQVPRGGTYRVKFDMYRGSGGTAYGIIYKNGVAHGTERSTIQPVFTAETFSEDLAFEAGDLIQIYLKGLGTYTMNMRNFRLYIGTDQQDPINLIS